MANKLLCIGSAYVDINCPNYPFGDSGLAPETEPVGNGYETTLGGSAVNFAKLCVVLGLDTAFVGKRGSDKLGDVMVQLFEDSGIEPNLMVDDAVQTNISFNMINSEGKSIMAIAGTANQALTSSEVTAAVDALLPESSCLYIGGCFKQIHLLDSYLQLTKDARANKVITILDHGRLSQAVTDEQKQKVRRLASLVDYYLPSRDEFLQLWGMGTIAEGLKNPLLSRPITIIKDGANGAWVLQNGEPKLITGFKVEPINTIGAGDSFNAGFIAAKLQGLGLSESVKFACATAALKISNNTLPTANAVKTLVASKK